MTIENSKAQSEMETLSGGSKVLVLLADNTQEEIFIQQLRLGQYDAAMKCYDDEISLVAFICGKEKSWVTEKLSGEGYEALLLESERVNEKGFFVFARRHQARLEEKLMRQLKGMTPEAIQAVTSSVARASQNSQLGLVPR